mmetsp:Transcript_5984/g.12332  ORF Transcript_5984/g.12332 Transcript_5984/m.12332 type:complete len:229 (+) Transcript_5984:83-769(+)
MMGLLRFRSPLSSHWAQCRRSVPQKIVCSRFIVNSPSVCASGDRRETITSWKRATPSRYFSTRFDKDPVDFGKLMGESLQPPAGRLWEEDDDHYIPEVKLHAGDGRQRRRVLVLCTGGTLTMAPSAEHEGALAPVEGALSSCMEHMDELQNRDQNNMPDYVLHEYTPFYDSSDLGPADWARVAHDIKTIYYQFDGFVVITGTDTMAYFATALSFMLENLAKPVVFTGS